jgi:hypothetical protein
VINLTASVGILLHETFGFFALPALALYPHSAIRERVPKRIGYLMPSLACMVLVIVFHGDSRAALAIHESWLPLWRSSCLSNTDLALPFSTIASIGWSVREGTGLTKGILQTGLYQPAAWAFVALTSFFLTLRFLRPDRKPEALARFAGLLVLQFGFVLPLFLLGIDYGRWLHLCGMSSVILYTLGYSPPTSGYALLARFILRKQFPALIHSIPCPEWIVLFFGIPILWSAANFIFASPAGRILAELLRGQSGR